MFISIICCKQILRVKFQEVTGNEKKISPSTGNFDR